MIKNKGRIGEKKQREKNICRKKTKEKIIKEINGKCMKKVREKIR